MFRWLIFFITLCSSAFCQQLVEGTIVEDGTGKPIPFASIILVGTSQGTSSNVQGQFSISVREPFSLKVTCIGFETAIVNSVADAKLIKLKQTATELDAVVVSSKPIKPGNIVKKAFARSSKNYSTQPFLQKFFYRHYCNDEGIYGRLIEASVDVWKDKGYKASQKESGIHDEIRITQLRRSLDRTKMSQGHDPISVKQILETDLLGYQAPLPSDHIAFYDHISSLKADIDKYAFTFNGFDHYDGLEVYDISYSRKDTVVTGGGAHRVRARIEGSLFITTGSYAIIKRDEVRVYGGDTIRTSTLYRKYDDVYYPYHFIHEGESYYEGKSIHAFHIEFMSVEIRKDPAAKFTGQLPGREELLNIPYDSMFWKTSTVLKTTPLEDDIISDLGGGASLSEQFKLYRQFEMNTTDVGNDGDRKFSWFKDYNKGKRILYLAFWSVQLQSYLTELEKVKQLHKQHRDDIAFVFLCLEDDVDLWEFLVQKYNLTADGIINYRLGGESRVARSLSVSQAPAFVLIGRDGEVIDLHARKPSDPKLLEELERLINQE